MNRKDTVFSVKPYNTNSKLEGRHWRPATLWPAWVPADVILSKRYKTSRSEEGCRRAWSGQGQGAPRERGLEALLDLPCARRPVAAGRSGRRHDRLTIKRRGAGLQSLLQASMLRP